MRNGEMTGKDTVNAVFEVYGTWVLFHDVYNCYEFNNNDEHQRFV